MRRPHLVVMTGLPGTGKTTIAGIAARQLQATLLTVDTIEESLWRAGISRQEPTGLAAYVVAQATAEVSLHAGISVVADAVNSVREAREAWRQTAAQTQSVLRVLEVVCSDPNEHRRRIRSRTLDPARPDAGSWQQVLARPFESWDFPEPSLVLDTCQMSPHDCRRALQSYLPTHPTYRST